MYIVLLVLLVLWVAGALPAWGWHHYGYGPSGLGLLLLVVLIFWLLGRGKL